MENNNLEENVVLEKPSLFGMIMNPKIQFERLRENPKILVALLIVTFLSLVGSAMMATGMEDVLRSMPDMQGLSEEEIVVVTIVSQITAIVGGLLTPVFMILLSTVIFIIIAKIVRSEVTFKQLFSMNTYISIITVLSLLLNGLFTMIFKGGNPEVYITSLNSIVGAEGVLGDVLNSIELFNIWSLIITGIGLQVVARFSKTLSWSVVVALYIIGLVFTIIVAALSSLGV